MEQEVQIPIGDIRIFANCIIPENASKMIIFAHGSGSGRFSPRNQYVARVLSQGGIATCLLDLLTKEEERVDDVTREHRFDIPMLANRLVEVSKWFQAQKETKHLRIGFFGASTGAAAALIGAAKGTKDIFAVVSRGGRPDLAMEYLPHVRAPTLLIVGGNDFGVIELNEQALAELQCEKKLEIVPGATHLFEEKGALEHVAKLALNWFLNHK